MGDPVRCLPKVVHPDVAALKLQHNLFDRYNIINEQELLDAGDQLVEYLAQQAQAVPTRRRPLAAGTAAPRTAPALRLVRRTTA